jgi:hypothetical protein
MTHAENLGELRGQGCFAGTRRADDDDTPPGEWL